MVYFLKKSVMVYFKKKKEFSHDLEQKLDPPPV
jgi:hypothetical protein